MNIAEKKRAEQYVEHWRIMTLTAMPLPKLIKRVEPDQLATGKAMLKDIAAAIHAAQDAGFEVQLEGYWNIERGSKKVVVIPSDAMVNDANKDIDAKNDEMKKADVAARNKVNDHAKEVVRQIWANNVDFANIDIALGS